MALHTFDCKNYLIQIDGNVIQGFDDDGTFDIEWEGDWWNDSNGADGDTTRSAQNDYRATVTLKLKVTSGSCAVLNALLLLDSHVIPGINPGTSTGSAKTNDTTSLLSITSIVPGGSSYIAGEVYLKKPAGVSVSKDASSREYALRCPALIPAETGI